MLEELLKRDNILEWLNQEMRISDFIDQFWNNNDEDQENIDFFREISWIIIQCDEPAEEDWEIEFVIATFNYKNKEYKVGFYHQMGWFYWKNWANQLSWIEVK